MTASEAIEIAKLKAKELNLPWYSDAVVSAVRPGLWRLFGNWKVIVRCPSKNSTLTMIVRERNRQAFPKRALYTTDLPARVQPHLILLLGLKMIISGVICWSLAHYIFNLPNWVAVLIAIPFSYIGALIGDVIFHKIRMRRYKNEDVEFDETHSIKH